MSYQYTHEDASKFARLLSQKGSLEDLLARELGQRYRDYRAKWEAAARFEERPAFPLNLDFELNFSCNLKCPMCTWSAEVKIPGKDAWMDFGLYKRIIDEAAAGGLGAVGFSWINEPLIRRDLAGFIGYARDAGVPDLVIHSNGTLLTPSGSEGIIDAGLTRMMFSLDALTEETYNKIRVGAKMPKVLKGIHEFLEIRARKGKKFPLVAVNFVLMSVNEHELDGFVEYWAPYVDFFSIQQYINPFEKKTRDQELFFASSREVLTDFRCQQPWQRMTVRYDGRVLPCCSFYAENLVIGDTRRQTIKEIWDSPEMRHLQEIHAAGEYTKNEICRQCASNWVVHEDRTAR